MTICIQAYNRSIVESRDVMHFSALSTQCWKLAVSQISSSSTCCFNQKPYQMHNIWTILYSLNPPPPPAPPHQELGQSQGRQDRNHLCFYHPPPIALRRRVVTVRSHRCTGRPGLSDFSWCRASVWTHCGMARFSCFRRWCELPCHCQPISVVLYCIGFFLLRNLLWLRWLFNGLIECSFLMTSNLKKKKKKTLTNR